MPSRSRLFYLVWRADCIEHGNIYRSLASARGPRRIFASPRNHEPPLLDARSLRRAHRPAYQRNSSRLYQSFSNTTRRNISWDKIKKKRKNKLQISGGHSCWFQLEALSIPTWRCAQRWNGIFIGSITPLANNDKIDLLLALRCVALRSPRSD